MACPPAVFPIAKQWVSPLRQAPSSLRGFVPCIKVLRAILLVRPSLSSESNDQRHSQLPYHCPEP